MNVEHRFQIEKDDDKTRIDTFLANKLDDLSRSYLQKCIDAGMVKVNGQTTRANYRLRMGDDVCTDIPGAKENTANPEDLPLDILYEDEDIIVINKARGIVVYPAAGNLSGTLVNALLYHTKDLSGGNGEDRPGIIHRLDKDTSGVIIVAKNDKAHREIANQFKSRDVKKTYMALVWGNVKDNKATINAPIGRHPTKRQEMTVTNKNSKVAVTHFTVAERFSDFTLLEVEIETGRTHQIRVHMKFIGHPIAGDKVYSKKKLPFSFDGQALHAYKIGFNHPKTGEHMEFTAPLPEDFISVLNILRQREG